MKQLDKWPGTLRQRRRAAREAERAERIYNGEVWVLEQGKDFTGSPTKAAPTFYVIARRKGLKLRTTVADNGRDLIVQALKPSRNGTGAAV